MKNPLIKFALPIAALSMLAFGLHHSLNSEHAFAIPRTEPPAFPSRTPFGRTIAAYGLVEARTENVSVGSPLAGVVLEVHISADKVGSAVQKGDALFQVDDRHLRAQRDFHAANLRVAESQLAKLEAQPRSEELPVSEAKVRAAESAVRLWRDQSERSQRLAAARVVTEEQNVERQLRLEAAEQELARAKAEDELLRAGVWHPDLEVARAQVELARAQLRQVEIEIERAIVRAPVDGHVLQVNVRPGEYVGANPQSPLFVIGDTSQLHVRVDIDEHDLPRFQSDLPAKAFVRGDGEREIPLQFVRVDPLVIPKKWLAGDNTERVDTRVLQVIYAVADPAPPSGSTNSGSRKAGSPQHNSTESFASAYQPYVGQMLDVFVRLPEPTN